MQKLKKAFASLTAPKAASGSSPTSSETPESRYEAARDQFLAYNTQLTDMKKKLKHMLETADAFCHGLVDLSEGVAPALSNHSGLRTDAGGYLNVMTTVSNSVASRFRKAVQTAVAGPIDSILSVHDELKRRVAERERALKQYNNAKRQLQDIQRKSVSKLGVGSSGSLSKAATGPSTSEAAKRAEVVNALSVSLTLYNTLTECLTDEFRTVLSVRDQVVAELFARLRSCQAYFFLGCGAAFTESQAEQMSAVPLLASPLHSRQQSPVASPIKVNPAVSPEAASTSASSDTTLVTLKPLPQHPSLEQCLIALAAIQESPALRWEALGRENRPRRALLHRDVPLNDTFDARSPKMNVFTSPTRHNRQLTSRAAVKPPKPPLKASEHQSHLSAPVRTVLFQRKRWIRRVFLGLSLADLFLISEVCVTWREVVKADGKLWDECTACGGVSDTVRLRFWEWVTGARGCGVPHWRRECVGSDAEVAVGGMMCDAAQFRMLKSFADTEASKDPTWVGEIDQDVLRTYVEGLKYGESRRRKHMDVASLQRLRLCSVTNNDDEHVDGPEAHVSMAEIPIRLSSATDGDLSVPDTDVTEASIGHSESVGVDNGAINESAPEVDVSIDASPAARRGTVYTWRDIDSKLDVSLGTYDINQLVSLSLFSDDGGDVASASPVADAEYEAGMMASPTDAAFSTPNVPIYTFAEFGVESPSVFAASGTGQPSPVLTSPVPAGVSTVPSGTASVALFLSDEDIQRHISTQSTVGTSIAGSPTSFDPELAFKRTQLRNLLRVIAVVEPSVGYTQGLNFVVAMLLETCDTQWRALNIIKRLFRQYDMQQMFASDLHALGLRFYQFERLMCRYLPKLQSHLATEHVSPAMYASSWFLTVFSSFSVFDLVTTRLVWDRFLCSGWKEVFRFALAVMHLLEPHLSGQSFEAMLPVLQAPRLYCDGMHDEIVQVADGFKVTKRLLSELESDFGLSS